MAISMDKNVGGYDRTARFVVGPILALVGIASLVDLLTIASGTLGLVVGAVLLLVGLVLTYTGFTQRCPLNSLLGLDTYRGSTAEAHTDEAERGSQN
jgi:uncharacterized membrane protein HdeD (DUF308 family)